MTGVWIILEVVENCEEHLVIGPVAAIEHAQLSFKNAKQFFNGAMFLTEDFDHVTHRALLDVSRSAHGSRPAGRDAYQYMQ